MPRSAVRSAGSPDVRRSLLGGSRLPVRRTGSRNPTTRRNSPDSRACALGMCGGSSLCVPHDPQPHYGGDGRSTRTSGRLAARPQSMCHRQGLRMVMEFWSRGHAQAARIPAPLWTVLKAGAGAALVVIAFRQMPSLQHDRRARSSEPDPAAQCRRRATAVAARLHADRQQTARQKRRPRWPTSAATDDGRRDCRCPARCRLAQPRPSSIGTDSCSAKGRTRAPRRQRSSGR